MPFWTESNISTTPQGCTTGKDCNRKRLQGKGLYVSDLTHHILAPVGFLTCSLSHHPYAEPASPCQLEAVIEVRYAIDARQMFIVYGKPNPSPVIVRSLSRVTLSLLDLLLHCLSVSVVYPSRWREAHQSAHGAVQSMPVVPSELGVGALERRVSVGLGLLDTVRHHLVSSCILVHRGHRSSERMPSDEKHCALVG